MEKPKCPKRSITNTGILVLPGKSGSQGNNVSIGCQGGTKTELPSMAFKDF